MNVRGSQHRTPANSLFLIPPGEVHFNDTYEDGCTFCSMLLAPSLLEGLAEADRLSLDRLSLARDPVLRSGSLCRRFDQVHHAMRKEQSELEHEELLLGLLAQAKPGARKPLHDTVTRSMQ